MRTTPGLPHRSIDERAGSETWEFDGVLRALQNAPAGEDGSEWNVSMMESGLQVYIAVDPYGPSVEVTDATDLSKLRWTAEGDGGTLTVEGNHIEGEGTFVDQTGSGLERQGSVEATCASWAEG